MARIGTHESKLRASARIAATPATDAAGLNLALRLAQLLDAVKADGPGVTDDELAVLKALGPLYLRTLTALGLTRDGRGVGDTQGGPGGVSADVAARDQLRARRERRTPT